MATRSEAVAPTWKEGSVTSWLTTVDHKRIGILYIVTSFLFFGAAGFMAMLMRIQLSQANSGFLTKGAYNEVVTMKLIAPRIEEMPVRWTPRIQRSCP